MKRLLLFCLGLYSCKEYSVYPSSINCATAYENLRKLGCEEAETSSKGITFLETCETLLSKKYTVDVKCLSSINSCSEVPSCDP